MCGLTIPDVDDGDDQRQPDLTWRSHLVRLVGMLVLSAYTWTWVAEDQLRYSLLVWVDVVLGLIGFVLVHFRRRAPMAIAVVLNLFGSCSAWATGPAALATISLAARRRWKEYVPVGLLFAASAITFYFVEPVNREQTPLWLMLTVTALMTVTQVSWGLSIGSRRELVRTLRQRAHRTEREQELLLAQARSSERALIAREMHDVLAHRISQVSMHAGALAFRDDLDLEEMRANAAVIQRASHAAMVDLRAVLGVLRDESSGEPQDRPQWAFDDLPSLLDEARESGVRVDFHDSVDAPVPDAIGRTVYRVVQEGITNVSKHAPGALLTVRISGSPAQGVTVLMRNPLSFEATPAPRSGLGLVGLAERLALHGGTLDHGVDHSTFWLKGWIPWAT